MSAPNQNTPNQNNNSPVVTIVLAIIALIGSLGVAWITAYYTAGRSFDQKLAESGTKIDELIKKIEPLDVKIKAAESKFTEIDGKLKVATDDLATFKSFLNESKRSVPVIWGYFDTRTLKKPGAKVNEGDADLKNSRNIQSIEWVDRKPADRRFFKVTFKGSFPVDAYQNGQYVATVTSTDDLTYVTEIFDHHLSVVCRPNCQFSLAIIGDLKSK